MKGGFSLAALITWLAPTTASLGQPIYQLTDLGTLGRLYSEAFAINEVGQVVGVADGAGCCVGFRTGPNSPMTDSIGTLGGQTSEAYAINSVGQVVGKSTGLGETFLHAFRTAPNSPINPMTDDLGTLGGGQSQAYGINDSGQVVGSSANANNEGRAFRTGPNAPINPITDDLGTLGGPGSIAFSINNTAQVVGYSYLPSGFYHAFRTAPNATITPATDDLGTLGGFASAATDINELGQAVGNSYVPGNQTYHAFRTAANAAINPATDDIGILPGGTISSALSINFGGTVVGEADVSDGNAHAIVYFNNTLYDLNNLIDPSLGWTLQSATGINELGQIVGYGRFGTNIYDRAFLLTPVPEPASIAWLTTAGLLVPRRMRRL